MNREDIIRMAREADQHASANHVKWIGPEVINMDWVVARDERFAALVAAAVKAEENEACAKVCDEYSAVGKIEEFDRGWLACAKAISNVIRARGQE